MTYILSHPSEVLYKYNRIISAGKWSQPMTDWMPMSWNISSSSSCALPTSVGIHSSQPLEFWINSVNIPPHHHLNLSSIVSLVLPMPVLCCFFPVIIFSNVLLFIICMKKVFIIVYNVLVITTYDLVLLRFISETTFLELYKKQNSNKPISQSYTESTNHGSIRRGRKSTGWCPPAGQVHYDSIASNEPQLRIG